MYVYAETMVFVVALHYTSAISLYAQTYKRAYNYIVMRFTFLLEYSLALACAFLVAAIILMLFHYNFALA